MEEQFDPPRLTFPALETSYPDSLGALELPPTVVHVSEPDVTLCFQSGNTPPNFEMLQVAFEATFLDKRLQPKEEPVCFELRLKENQNQRLGIWLHSEGIHKGGTVLLSIESGKDKQWYYLRPEMERKEEIWLRVH